MWLKWRNIFKKTCRYFHPIADTLDYSIFFICKLLPMNYRIEVRIDWNFYCDKRYTKKATIYHFIFMAHINLYFWTKIYTYSYPIIKENLVFYSILRVKHIHSYSTILHFIHKSKGHLCFNIQLYLISSPNFHRLYVL